MDVVEVKGTAFIARRTLLVREFGQAKAEAIVKEIAKVVPFFDRAVLATTLMPIESFLAFNDELARRYYADLPNPYFHFGEQSAEWALREGPYKNHLAERNLPDFIARGTALYRNYYELGDVHLTHERGRVVFKIDRFPILYRHPHFEFNPAGYLKRSIELLGVVDMQIRQLAGFSKGDAYVHFEFLFRESPR